MQIRPPTRAESLEPRRQILPGPRSRDPPARGGEEAPVSNPAGGSVTTTRMEQVDDQFAKYPSTKNKEVLVHMILHFRIGIPNRQIKMLNKNAFQYDGFCLALYHTGGFPDRDPPLDRDLP